MNKELNEYRQYTGPMEAHKAVSILYGMLRGMACDGEISEKESEELSNWFCLYKTCINRPPFKSLASDVEKCLSDGRLDQEEAKDMIWLCNQYLDYKNFDLFYDGATACIQELEGMLEGFLSDGQLADNELDHLYDWLDEHDFLASAYPYDEIYSLLIASKADHVISEDERNLLKAYFSTFIDTRDSANINAPDMEELREKYSIGGICAVCPEVEFGGKIFCFTGASQRATRDKIAFIIESNGGVFSGSVTKDTDYLIVGSAGNPCWAYSCYGRKVEKAMALRKQGHNIVIVNESDFWEALADKCSAYSL